MVFKGICLRATNYKERDKLLTLATLEKGKITLVARGVRKPSAKLKAGCMPMVFGEFTISQGKGRPILTGIDVEENFYNCWTNTDKNLAAFLVLELLEKATLQNQDISREIVFALKALNEINYSEVYPFAPAVWFVLRILKYIGVDYSVEELPKTTEDIFNNISSMEIQDVETLDITPANIITAIDYLNLIIKNQLSIKLHIIDQIKLAVKQI